MSRSTALKRPALVDAPSMARGRRPFGARVAPRPSASIVIFAHVCIGHVSVTADSARQLVFVCTADFIYTPPRLASPRPAPAPPRPPRGGGLKKEEGGPQFYSLQFPSLENSSEPTA